MNIKKITIIGAMQWCWLGSVTAAELPPNPLSDLANKAFSEKDTLDTRTSTAEIEGAIRSLAAVSMEKLKSGNESQKKVAARVLGALREKKAINLLIENIGLVERWQVGSGAKVKLNLEYYPACVALKNIGGPEVAAAVNQLHQSKSIDDKTLKIVEALLSELYP